MLGESRLHLSWWLTLEVFQRGEEVIKGSLQVFFNILILGLFKIKQGIFESIFTNYSSFGQSLYCIHDEVAIFDNNDLCIFGFSNGNLLQPLDICLHGPIPYDLGLHYLAAKCATKDASIFYEILPGYR